MKCHEQSCNLSKTENLYLLCLTHCVVLFSGWVIRKLIDHMQCTACKLMLVTDTPSIKYTASFHLLTHRQTGGLFVPSDGTVEILRSAEKHIRYLSAQKLTSVSVLRIQTLVMTEMGTRNVFGQIQHEKETQEGIENHYRCLIRELVKVYVNLRVHRLVKLHNAQIKGHTVRHNYMKTIKFKGQ